MSQLSRLQLIHRLVNLDEKCRSGEIQAPVNIQGNTEIKYLHEMAKTIEKLKYVGTCPQQLPRRSPNKTNCIISNLCITATFGQFLRRPL